MKRFVALALLLVLLLALLSPAAQAADLYFVAVNDTVPLTLSGDSAPFYSGGVLYAARAVFSVSGLGITPSYNETNSTFTLFGRNARIVFYLDENRSVDETGAALSLTAIRRQGVVFVPVAACAEHFGRSVSYLTSAAGYRVLRFTSGTQVYDDSLFLEKAANLLQYRATQYQSEQSGDSTQQPVQGETETPEKTPVTVYLAVTGADTMAKNLSLLSANGTPAVFFLTSEEIEANPQLVCDIRAAGYPIGLTVPENAPNAAEALRNANEALDRVLCCKSLFALVTRAQRNDAAGFFTLSRSAAVSAANAAKQSGGKALVILAGDASAQLKALREAEVRFRQLRENTF